MPTRKELLERISTDPNICFGKACIRGTRIWVALIVENLADGVTEKELLDTYPELTLDDIRAALAYAAEVTRERVLHSPPSHTGVRFKLDENLDARLVSVLTERGHEADSVREEGLAGRSDKDLFGICASERRALITPDLDFADPIRFPPAESAGIIVLRPRRSTLSLIRETLVAMLPMLERERLDGVLWIVEPGRVRINRPWDSGEDC